MLKVNTNERSERNGYRWWASRYAQNLTLMPMRAFWKYKNFILYLSICVSCYRCVKECGRKCKILILNNIGKSDKRNDKEKVWVILDHS